MRDFCDKQDSSRALGSADKTMKGCTADAEMRHRLDQSGDADAVGDP